LGFRVRGLGAWSSSKPVPDAERPSRLIHLMSRFAFRVIYIYIYILYIYIYICMVYDLGVRV